MTRMTNHGDVVIDIKAMLEQAGPPVTEECCIYTVSFDIRKFNEDAYTPKVVSIGPSHHSSNPRLHNMERHKLIYCNAFLQRTNTSVHTWIRYIEEVMPDFRRCYSDTLQFSTQELVKIIFVDSGFLFELFWKDYYDEWSGNDAFLLKPLIADTVSVDLLLLENQLPFFVLARLFNLSFSTNNNINIPSFIQLTFKYFAYYNRSNLSFDDNNIRIRHFTDLIRIFHLQHPREKRPGRISEQSVIHLPSATELSEAGLKFKVNDKSECCLLDLRFSGRVLEMPQLKVEDRTEVLFRNMVALEQCYYPYESYVTDYVAVLDFLVNTSRDVDLLVQNKVLVNWLGDSDSVTNLFNGLLKNITHTNDNSRYLRISRDLNVFYSNPWNNLKSTLRSDYCKTPWQTAASVAGIVLLILSFIQTVCSLLQVIPH